MAYSDILKLVPTMQSTALVSDNLKFVDKKKKTTKDFIGQGVKNIIGANLISETANFI